ncbi:MAG: GNAT family N-acetyltransferase [Anaerolineaceae bacterium]|nr:GNAT family N-acetyltransferase [Anaerolineaceae bacterium]
MNLKLAFLAAQDIPQAKHDEIDALDQLAYENVAGHEENQKIEWASSQWIGLGSVDGCLATQLGCLEREIRINGHSLWVSGIGGVATHPQFQRKGYAKALLQATEKFIREELNTSFALLLCDGMPCELYRSLGWQDIADHVLYQQGGQTHRFESNVMIFQFSDESFPVGEIDLCGSPW